MPQAVPEVELIQVGTQAGTGSVETPRVETVIVAWGLSLTGIAPGRAGYFLNFVEALSKTRPIWATTTILADRKLDYAGNLALR